MTRYELRRQLITILTDLCTVVHMLEHTVRSGVPPDAQHVVQLHTTVKLVCSILAKLDELEPTVLEESA